VGSIVAFSHLNLVGSVRWHQRHQN